MRGLVADTVRADRCIHLLPELSLIAVKLSRVKAPPPRAILDNYRRQSIGLDPLDPQLAARRMLEVYYDTDAPLPPATCRRIAAGIVRFVLQGKPFLVETGNGERFGQAPRVRSIDEPMLTVTGSGSPSANALLRLPEARGALRVALCAAPYPSLRSVPA